MTETSNDTFATTVPSTIASQTPEYLVSASDYFNNTSTVQFKPYGGPQTIVQQTTLQPSTTGLTSTATTYVTPLVGAAPNPIGFAVLALGIAGGLIPLILLGIFLRRPGALPPPPAAIAAPVAAPPAPVSAERNLYCQCPYWIECARVHSQCPTCTRLRQYGACCACYIMPPVVHVGASAPSTAPT